MLHVLNVVLASRPLYWRRYPDGNSQRNPLFAPSPSPSPSLPRVPSLSPFIRTVFAAVNGNRSEREREEKQRV